MQRVATFRFVWGLGGHLGIVWISTADATSLWSFLSKLETVLSVR